MTTRPEIELRRISHNERLSQETNAYAADLWVDGVKWGEVGNDGHGGADWFHPAKGSSVRYDDIAALDARIAATMAPVEAHGMTLTQSLELVCSNLLADWLMARDLKRAMTRKVMFTKPDQPGVFEVPLRNKGRMLTVAQVVQYFSAKDPTFPGRTLNMMPFDAALALYVAAAR